MKGMIKRIVFLSALLMLIVDVQGQVNDTLVKGTVSYLTSQNVYVKFQTTRGIKTGDTLFFNQSEKLIPALIVRNLSSISCVCEPIGQHQFSESSAVFFKAKANVANKQEPKEIEVIQNEIITTDADTVVDKPDIPPKPVQDVYGRVAVSSSANFSNTPSSNSNRMRYNMSLNVDNISSTPLSAETYFSFVYRNDRWSEVQDNIFNALKIYSLALRYDINPGTTMWLGRRISRQIPVMGAMDGLQFEKKLKDFSMGVIAGTRPDYRDYGFNAALMQFGAYVSHQFKVKKGFAHSTVSFIEQKNNGKTDRRFAYFQHTNSLINKVYFFASAEVDLYMKTAQNQNDSPRLTNLYFSLRYRPIRKLSVTASYSRRNNVIYYESYQENVDRLLENGALSGYSLALNYQPVNKISVGVRGSYRDRKDDPEPTMNFYGYVTMSQVPVIKASATASVSIIETAYLSGKTYSLMLNRDLISGKLYGGLGFRHVDYSFKTSEASLGQSMPAVDITWRILKNLYFSANYEGTFEKVNHYHRVYVNLTQRF